MDNEIEISHKIDKVEGFNCIICFDIVYLPFYQCNSSIHFVCPECISEMKSMKCPSCIENTLFHNKMLEKQLGEYLDECPNSLCSVRHFKWESSQHYEDCTYSPSKCFFCSSIVDSDKVKSHLTNHTECNNVQFARKDQEGLSGSLTLLEHFHWINNGFIVKLENVQSNLVVIWNELILMLKKEVDNWRVAVIDSSKDYFQVDGYFKPYESGIYEIQTILVMTV
jgi:hypothetical protein